MDVSEYHQPVLLNESLEYLITDLNGIYVDCTLGGGGHSFEILKKLSPNGFLIGIDADSDAIQRASEILAEFRNKFLRRIFFDQLDVVLHEVERYPVDGVLYDLGLSSHHLNHSYRGFAFQAEAPLDMRFNQAQGLTAADVVNEYSEEDLGRIIREYGEESRWRRIAAEIVRRRQESRLETTRDLAELVRNIVGERKVIKSLAKVFQAIRIEVNLELERLKNSLEQAFYYLKEGGRIVVISYHSLEDRITKEFFRYKALSCICPDELPVCVCNKVPEMRILTRKLIKPAEEEVRRNPRSRSARLRAAEKIIPFTDV